MTKSLTLCASQDKHNYEKDLNKYILRAKKLLWYIQKDKKQKRLDEIMEILNKKIEEKKD